MADDLIDRWLDEWEALVEGGETISPTEFIARYHSDASDHFAKLFLERAAAMVAVDCILGAPKSTGPKGDTSTSKPLFGSLVSGTEPVTGYRLVRRLGAGGFGEVWEGRGAGDFPVALKFVNRAARTGRIEREAIELLKGIRHPHLLAIFGLHEAGPWFVIVSELADGTLAARLQECRQQGLVGIPEAELLGYLREISEGLDHLHGARIQHRDIKPANLLLVGGAVKIGDPGLLKEIDSTAGSHSGSHTTAYAPPEFFQGKTHAHSDQYSLAISYCEMCGGRLPFNGTSLQVMKGHCEQPPDLTMIPEPERPIVGRALAKEPSQRWPSCKSFVGELERAQKAASAGLSPASRSGKVRKRFAIGLSGVALIAISWYIWSKSADHNSNGSIVEPTALNKVVDKKDVEAKIKPLILRGHKGAVTNVAFAGSDRAVSAGTDGTVRIWNLASGDELRAIPSHETKVVSLAVSKDGRTILAGGDQQHPEIRIWNALDGDSQGSLNGHTHGVRGITFLFGDRAASASYDGSVRIWDVKSRTSIHRIDLARQPKKKGENLGSQAWCIAAEPKGNRVVVGVRDGTVRHVDAEIGVEIGQWPVHKNFVNAIALPLDNRGLLTANGDAVFTGIGPKDDKVRWFHHPGPQLVQELHRPVGSVWSVAVCRDGRKAVAGGENGVFIWDLETNKEIARPNGPRDVVESVAVSPDGRSVLAGSRDGAVYWWANIVTIEND